MIAPPLAPGGRDHRPEGQLESARSQRADDRHPLERRPQRPGLLVEHQLVRAIKQAARAEGEMARADDAVVGNHRAAQRAVDDRQLDAADPVDGQLVPGQDPLGIGAGLAVHHQAEHHVPVLQPAGVGRWNGGRKAQRRDAVHGHAAPVDFVEPDAGLDAGRKERAEAGIDPGIDLGLERRVVRVRRVGLRPHPAPPRPQVVAEALTRVFAEKAGQTAAGVGPRRRPDDGGKIGAAPGCSGPFFLVADVQSGHGDFVTGSSARAARRRQEARHVDDHRGIAVPPAGANVVEGGLGLPAVAAGGGNERLPGRRRLGPGGRLPPFHAREHEQAEHQPPTHHGEPIPHIIAHLPGLRHDGSSAAPLAVSTWDSVRRCRSRRPLSGTVVWRAMDVFAKGHPQIGGA